MSAVPTWRMSGDWFDACWPAVALLGLASAFVIHPPPVGPVALVCFAAGALLVERMRTRAIASIPDSDSRSAVPYGWRSG